MNDIKTVKIKSSHPSQGEYIVINEEDFDDSKHELYGVESKPKRGRKSRKAVEDVDGNE